MNSLANEEFQGLPSEGFRRLQHQLPPSKQSKPQQWEYPLEILPFETLLYVGFSEIEARAVVLFLMEIKRITTGIRQGDHDFNIELVYIDDMIRHGDVLLPYWQEFASSLYHFAKAHEDFDEEDTRIAFYDVELPRDVLNVICPAVKRIPFKEISFNGCLFENGIGLVSDLIQDNTGLEVLCVSYSNLLLLHSPQQLSRLCSALNSCSSLKKIEIERCEHENDDLNMVFGSIESKSLIELTVSNSNISNLGHFDLSNLLSSNPALHRLDLSGNALTNDDLTIIADALKQNSTLQSICLDNNQEITSWDVLEDVIFNKTSLNTASDSNHHLRCHCMSTGQSYNMNEHNIDPAENRRIKICIMLSERNMDWSNIHHFEEDGIQIQLLPCILESIQLYSESLGQFLHSEYGDEMKVEPLSIIYEIIMGWHSLILNCNRECYD